MYYCFICKMKYIFETSFPLVRVSRKRLRDKPWITKGLKISIKRNHKYYRNFINHPNSASEAKYSKFNKILRKCLRKAEILYYEELFLRNKMQHITYGKILVISLILIKKLNLHPLANCTLMAPQLLTVYRFQI